MRYFGHAHTHNHHMKRTALIISGWLSLALGVIGAFLPLLPTVPLVLLSATCFARSSPRFHQWLIQHPRFGPIIEQYQNGQGIPRAVKIRAIVVMVISMGLSAYWVGRFWVTMMLTGIGLAMSWYIWTRSEPP